MKSANPNVCADCERLLEDITPREAAAKLLAEQLPAPDAKVEVSHEPDLVSAPTGASHQV